ncbi:MAG: hypothetical protein PHO89_09365 [Methylacidiphilaceae bacterium]|nr:hypothetical protein [Candidatus Methylacidiphilaceae bacterium]
MEPIRFSVVAFPKESSVCQAPRRQELVEWLEKRRQPALDADLVRREAERFGGRFPERREPFDRDRRG